MIDITSVSGFAAVSLAIALSPGPSWIYVISTTARQGRTAGLAAVAGNATGIVCHVAAAALGLSAILHYSSTLYTAIRWIGSLYLMFIAIRIIRDRSIAALARQECEKRTLRRVYRGGVLMNVLNPKVSLLMLALLPQFVVPSHGNATMQIVALGGLHVVIASCVLTLIVTVAAGATGLLTRKRAVETTLRWTMGALLFGFGARMALAEKP